MLMFYFDIQDDLIKKKLILNNEIHICLAVIRVKGYDKQFFLPLIFMKFSIRSSINKFDLLTPQDLYYLPTYLLFLGKWFYLKAWFIYLTIKLRQWKAASGEEDNQTAGSSKKGK